MSKSDKSVVGNGGFEDGGCKVAMVGAGYMAKEHIKAFQDVPGVNVVGIHSRSRSRAEALALEYQIPAVCDSISELFERTNANLVVIAVPELSANDVCCSCFEYPWAALIEKPAGYNLADAEEIERVAQKNKRSAYVALNRRHFGSTRAVLEDVASQSGPRLIRVRDQENPKAGLLGGQPQLVVDNWMYANSIHIIDYFSFLGRGAVSSVTPIIRWNPEVPLYVAARIQFDSGDIGLYEAVWDAPAPWVVTVNTPEKYWELRPLEKAASLTLGGKKGVAKGMMDPVEDEPWDSKFKPGLRRQAELVVRAASGKVTDMPTLQDALATMRLTQAIYS